MFCLDLKSLKALILLISLVCSTVATADTITYFHNDISGSPLLATDSNGSVLWRENYLPYGNKLNKQPNSSNNKIGFHGKSHDDSTGLSYMGYRYYDPLVGRFMGIDPKEPDIQNIHSLNRYNYANNNPYKYVDPDGHSPIDVVFLAYDVGKLGVAMYTGVGVSAAAADVAMSVVGVVSPVPGTGQVLKAARATDKALDAVKAADNAADIASSTIKANKAAGEAFEKQVATQLQDTQTNVVQQITVKTESGIKTRIDIAGYDAKGNIVCTECKASDTAPLTKNQKAAFPEIEKTGATVVGKGKPGMQGGTQIPPTRVVIIRPDPNKRTE